ncbi:hypothetical protein SMU86_10420, partial [Streptococcus mutans U2A]
MSCIYWFYFIKQKHMFNLMEDILKPTSIWGLVRSSVFYFGFLILWPMLYQLIARYFLRFNNFDSLLINKIKLVVMVDAGILLLVSILALVMYFLMITFSDMDDKSRKEGLLKEAEYLSGDDLES